jgi:hypothetical protein
VYQFFHHCDGIPEINYLKGFMILANGFSPQLADAIVSGSVVRQNIVAKGHEVRAQLLSFLMAARKQTEKGAWDKLQSPRTCPGVPFLEVCTISPKCHKITNLSMD